MRYPTYFRVHNVFGQDLTFLQPIRAVTICLWAFTFGGSALLVTSLFPFTSYVKELLVFWKL